MLRFLVLAATALAALPTAAHAYASIDSTVPIRLQATAPTFRGDGEILPWRVLLPLLLEMEIVNGRQFGLLPAPPPWPQLRPLVARTTIYFGFDRTEVTPKAREALERFVASIGDQPGEDATEILIIGHTDRAGSEAYNLELSRRRAEAVAATLARMGVTIEAASDLQIEAKGESDLALPTADGVSAAVNRRAVITALARGNTAGRGHRPKDAGDCFEDVYCLAETSAPPRSEDAAGGSRWWVILRISGPVTRRP